MSFGLGLNLGLGLRTGGGGTASDNLKTRLNGQADLEGTLQGIPRNLAGSLTGSANLTGDVSVIKELAGSFTGTADLVGDLTVEITNNEWTPADLGSSLSLWLDADDANTITLNGSTVSQWDDKSGNAHHFAQATAADQPVYSTGALNGKNVLTFNGTSNYLSRSEYTYGTTHSLFIVCKYTGASTITATTTGFALIQGPATNSAIYGGPWSGVFTDERLGYYTGTNGFTKTDADIDATSPLLLSFAINNSSTNAVSRLNGTADFLTTNGTNVPSSVGYIGAFSSGTSAFFPGLFCEFIIVESALSVADVEKTEGYLAWKWGGV